MIFEGSPFSVGFGSFIKEYSAPYKERQACNEASGLPCPERDHRIE